MLREILAPQCLQYSPPARTTNVVQKTLVAFKFSFYPFSGNGCFLACFLSTPAVHEVGRWFAVLPVKGVFAYGT